MAKTNKTRTTSPYSPRKRKKLGRNKRNGMQKKAAMDSVVKMNKKGFGRKRG